MILAGFYSVKLKKLRHVDRKLGLNICLFDLTDIAFTNFLRLLVNWESISDKLSLSGCLDDKDWTQLRLTSTDLCSSQMYIFNATTSVPMVSKVSCKLYDKIDNSY